MQKSDNTVKAQSTHRRVKSSTTLNRKYVRRPNKFADITVRTNKTTPTSPRIQRFNYQANDEFMKQARQTAVQAKMQPAQPKAQAKMQPAQPKAQPTQSMMQSKKQPMHIAVETHPMQTTARARMQARTATAAQPRKISAKELKEQAIQKALQSAAKTPTMAEQITSSKKQKKSDRIKFGVGRVILAVSCAAAAVLAIIYFVNLNMPDFSLRVAAMQTGINASYPSYVPRDFKLSGVTSENNKVVLDFSGIGSDDSFVLTEEKSSWDSNALLNNYVKPTYHDDFTTVREQGLTIYISGSNAAWVNGGTIYKITAKNNVLTNKQIRSIAASL